MRQFQHDLPELNNPYAGKHDLKTTEATIKEILKDGTPDWIKRPEEYRNFAQEAYLADKEVSDAIAADYKLEDQDLMVNKKARYVNIMGSREFLRKLRINGIKCFTFQNPKIEQQAGLWCETKTPHGSDFKYICYIQIPAMVEWSILRLDNHGLSAGEDYRGWRTVLSELIKKDVLSEQKAHEIFGAPSIAEVSRRYRKTLYLYRNRKQDNGGETLLSEA